MLTMSVSIKQSVLISLGILGVGSGVALLWIHRNKKRHLRLKRIQVELSKAIQAQNGVRKSKCHINLVQSIKDWEAIEKKFLKILGQHPIVGFDVEWVTPQGGSPRPVSLVQISFYTGWVILLRINKMESIPETLKDMLTDSEVIKMGVGIFDDAQKLKKDLGLPLRGALDLRHFVREHRPLIKKTGLAGLAMAFLGTEMDKDWRIRASDWETDPLSKRQLEYAANDALVATNIMLQIALESLEDSTQVANLWQLSKYSYVLAKKYYGVPFRLARNKSKTPGKESKNGTKSKPGPNPPKDPTAKMVTRKSKMYHNAKLEAPDGQPLCVCDTKKAQWYIEKGLGTLIQESDGTDECPMIVRLTFEPSGRPLGAAGDYYLSNKENVCVVCGQTESYVRKYIVPHEYRTHFPEVMRDHQSHDILLMCVSCHQRSNILDTNLRHELADLCNAPIGTESDVKQREDCELKKVRSAGRALLNDREKKIPADRAADLVEILKEYYNVQEVSEEVLKKGANCETAIMNDDYCPHGKKVVEHFMKGPGIISLEKRWRVHFLKTMSPKYLPKLWSVDHQQERLEIRNAENRIDKEDYALATGNRTIDGGTNQSPQL